MNKKSIILVSDFEFDQAGFPTTGYTNIAVTLGNALTTSGKYRVYGFGFSYKRQETQTKFGINYANPADIIPIVHTLYNGLNITDILYVFDIPFIEAILERFKHYQNLPKLNQYGIFAVESDPLCTSWAMSMSRLKKWGVISRFGTEEAKKAGLPAVHYPVPIDLSVWKKRDSEQKEMVKKALGLENKFVIFINADGNERKNLSAMLEGLSIAIKTNPKIHVVLLTRKNFQLTWRLDDLMIRLGIEDNLTIVDRGIQQEDVWKLYVGADVLFNISKAEGLCLPILEAMAVGVPVVATNATAMKESLSDGRGYLLDADYVWIDPFGNTNRYFVFPEKIAAKMLDLANKPEDIEIVAKARKYVEERTIENALSVIEGMLE